MWTFGVPRSHGGNNVRRDQTTHNSVAGAHGGILWIRHQRPHDVVPVFASKLLGLGPVEVGYLWSALGVGLLLMSTGLLRFTEWNLSDRTKIIAGASVASALAIGVLIWTRDLYLISLLMIVIGGGMGAFSPIAWGTVQELTPRMMVGRALGLYSTGTMTATMSGISMFGWVTERFGGATGTAGSGATFLLTASEAG